MVERVLDAPHQALEGFRRGGAGGEILGGGVLPEEFQLVRELVDGGSEGPAGGDVVLLGHVAVLGWGLHCPISCIIAHLS